MMPMSIKDSQMNIEKMKVKVRPTFVKVITFGFAAAICLWPFGIYLAKDKYLNNKELINHESIHWKQQIEMLGIFFYLWYLFEWIAKLFIYGKQAYNNLSFEREANAHEDDLDYLATRRCYAWFKYL